MSHAIEVRLRTHMLIRTSSFVEPRKTIQFPGHCGFPALRHTIRSAFHLPSQLEIEIFLPSREIVNAGNFSRIFSLGRLPLAISFNVDE